ncbi:probable cytochrome P450 9f2 [Neodiprion virginianus]|uniref:probable cytochrome P450 9f2 n=1 Tax=Neodiprion virginianus TaxID=2961670 RepID=UPI001EE749BE|nr:probable cytochrome P450 9f2 [Neodiprion virginianus]
MYYIYIACGISLLGAWCYHYLTKNNGYWEKKCVPCPKGAVPGFGHFFSMYLMRKNVFQLGEEFYNEMPGRSMVGLYNAGNPTLLVRDPELVKAVLQTSFASFNSNGIEVDPQLDRLGAKNPFFLVGDEWKSSRQLLSLAYTPGKLKYIYESINVVCASFVKYLNNKVNQGNGEFEIELKDLYSKFTAEVAASSAFGVEGHSFSEDEDGTFTKIGKTIFQPTIIKGIKTMLILFVPLVAKVLKARFMPLEVQQLLVKLVKDMIKYRTDHNVQRKDSLQLMIDLKKSGTIDPSTGREYDDETIIGHATTFFIEGYETSSVTLSFFAHLLASHLEIQQRVREEVLTVAEKHNGITYEALQEMTYLEQALYESMRIYPAAGTLFKVCTSKIEFQGSDGITCEVEPGTSVMISLAGMQKDPEYWPDPEKFDPDRFSEDNKQARHKFLYIPFGGGPRACIGMRMAMLQIKAAIATTLGNFTLEVSPKTQLPIKLNPFYFMAAAKGGLWVKIKPL